MRKIAEMIILITLFTSVIYSLILIFTSSVVVNYQFYAGTAGLTIIAITRIWNQKISALLLTGILAMGTVNIVEFSHYTFSLILNIIPFLNINPLILLLFSVELLINGDTIREFLNDNTANKSDSGIETDYKQMEIERFLSKYENLSNKELQSIADKKNGYVEYARIAAECILDKRNSEM